VKLKLRWFLPVLLAGGLLAAVLPSGAAPDKGEEKEKQEKADAIGDLITAYKMADFGRESKSPEALIAAASLLRKVSAGRAGKLGALTEKPVDDNDKPVAEGTLKTRSLEEEANDLFRDASDLAAAGDAKVSKAVDQLIKEAKERKYGLDDGVTKRGAFGGPKWVSRPIAPGEAHVYNIPFVTGVPAALGLKSTGMAPLHVKMHIGGFVHFDQVVKFGEYNWVPKPDVPVKTFTIRITNVSGRPTAYTLLTN
jgi:hypothetical protein